VKKGSTHASVILLLLINLIGAITQCIERIELLKEGNLLVERWRVHQSSIRKLMMLQK
jgi:hypothetical protein